ncbi:hypothetical protein TIFTF001_004247 [Ficus carica]|uniref:Uncharacterized protein n=1 Tax=Ficus carica TaxID=3494 RepID=A0AA87ZAZ5_FICCA|nr:hypothetical protein TIFTF001_004247 [Ficus carica]
MQPGTPPPPKEGTKAVETENEAGPGDALQTLASHLQTIANASPAHITDSKPLRARSGAGPPATEKTELDPPVTGKRELDPPATGKRQVASHRRRTHDRLNQTFILPQIRSKF